MYSVSAFNYNLCMCIHNTYNQIPLHTNFTSSTVFLSAHDNSLTAYQVQHWGLDTPNDVDDMFYESVTVSAGMELSYNTSGLLDHSAYNVSVRATNQYGVRDFSEEVTVWTEERGECVALYTYKLYAHCAIIHTHTHTHTCTCIWYTYSTSELTLYTHLQMVAQTRLIHMPSLRPQGIFLIHMQLTETILLVTHLRSVAIRVLIVVIHIHCIIAALPNS